MDIPRDEQVDGDTTLHDLSEDFAKSEGQSVERFRKRFPSAEDLLENGSVAELLQGLIEEAEKLETTETCEPRTAVEKADSLRARHNSGTGLVREIYGRLFQGDTVDDAVEKEMYSPRRGAATSGVSSPQAQTRVAEHLQFSEELVECLRVDLADL